MNIEDYPAPKPVNMENFGSLQYIIDKLPSNERRILVEYFVNEVPKSEIIGQSTRVVNRILYNLRKIDLTSGKVGFKIKGKVFPLKGLDGRTYRE